MNLFNDTESSGAHLSDDRVYRYRLWRRWGDGDQMTFIGVNPSTADETIDDQTIKKCRGFAKRNGCEAIQMLNLFAFRSRDPAKMKQHNSPIGPLNDAVLVEYATQSRTVVACWGDDGKHLDRASAVIELLDAEGVEVMCFGLTKKKYPRHPVMLAYSTPLVSYKEALADS